MSDDLTAAPLHPATTGVSHAGELIGRQDGLLPAMTGMPSHEVFETVAGYFATLSHPTRLRILHAVCGRELTVNEIAEQTGSTQSNVSRQLTAMYAAGAVGRRKEGTQVFYRVVDEALLALCKTVCGRIAAHLEDRRQTHAALLDMMAGRG